jgi:uncharacterized membrane protein
VELYDFLLFVHIAFAVIWIGGAAIIQFLALPVLASGDARRLATFAGDVGRIGNLVFTPAALLTVLAGFALVWEAEFWSLGDDWIVIGLVLFGISFLTGVAFLGPESGRIKKLIEAEGPEAAQPRIRRLLILSRIDLVVLFLIIFDMSVKPSLDDGWTIVGALLVAIALAFAFTAPALRARPAQAV